MKPGLGGLARRYARALLDVALETGTPEDVARELRDAVKTIEGNAELRTVLHHPALHADKKRGIVSALWHEGLTARLLALLAERGRLELLPAIADGFERAWNESRGVASGEAVSATPLGEAQLQALRAAIGKSLGLRVDLKTRVDESLLGGLRVTIGGRTYDGSVRTQLRALRERLAAGGA